MIGHLVNKASRTREMGHWPIISLKQLACQNAGEEISYGLTVFKVKY